ncbi:hypothetical protein CMK11_02055 [Candidatus Poribacteria bacterium]|jgi:hypothetical protein|nr:hypothetical protein [Candidatus Poribacteria bacterium]
MAGVMFVMLMSCTLLCATAVAIVYMGIQYASRKRGLTKGASTRELDEIRQRLDVLGDDLHAMHESIADLTLMLGDASSRRLPGDGA